MKKATLASLFLIIASVTPALAHLKSDVHGSFAAGLSHPLLGMDHILVMIAVGLWAWQFGGRSIWVVPSTFVGTMVLGFILALVGVPLPFVEPTILASVVTLGLLVALAVTVPVSFGATVIGFFALFHGYAHGGEIGAATQITYAIGFAISTALLHVVGIGIGYTLNALLGDRTHIALNITRVLGGLTVIGGIGLFAI